MNYQKIIVFVLFVFAIIYLYKKLSKSDDNCGNGDCNCD
ncbi:MAG: FeoB-associated Cys-rich membrane protein [Flavobacteriales bacterium]|nr:FeoB-associated Cys-rich membrane protein [Flavobacteriales bacterium]